MKTIIFVCHGNICRSPAAEYIFKKKIKELNREDEFNVFSRALSYEEIGHDIYPPMKEELDDRNVPYHRHFANIISKDEFDKADYIFYMDKSNKNIISYMFNDDRHIVHPIFEYTPSISNIEDPWYTDRFSFVFEQIEKCITDILNNI